jgi:transcriptional regulator of arginine metabolism
MQAPTRNQRHLAITTLLNRGPVPSQEALVQALSAQGMGVNQATLSRDLKSLGAVKGPGGYQLVTIRPIGAGALAEAVADCMISMAVTLNQVVLKTPPGGAQPLAIALDGARLPGMLGTLAGDDTVLCVLKDEAAAKEFGLRLKEMVL